MSDNESCNSDCSRILFVTPPNKRRNTEFKYETNYDFRGNLNKLINNEAMHDVTFKIGNQTILACKLLLSANSDYFNSMFSNYSESISSEPIVIEGIEYPIFESIIKYVSTGSIIIDYSNIVSICIASHFHQIDSLTKECVIALKHVKEKHYPDLFIEACNKSVYNPYCDHDVDNKDNSFIKELIKKLTKCSGFDNMTNKLWLNAPIIVAKIIMKLSVSGNEIEIFEYMMEYATIHGKDKESRDKILHELKYFVKLPYVYPEYIYKKIRPLNIYSTEDICEAFAFTADREIFKDKSKKYKFTKRLTHYWYS